MQKFLAIKKVLPLLLLILTTLFVACSDAPESAATANETPVAVVEEEPQIRYGIDFNKYDVKELKIKRGDTFGAILENNGIDYPQVFEILQKIKGKVNVRKLQIGKPYTLLFSKDSLPQPKYFIYHPDVQEYSLIALQDSILGKKVTKEIKIVEQLATGVIESSLYETMQNSGYNS